MADKIKKLSEAIRLGATFRPQCNKYGAGTDNEGKTSCALVAAVEASLGIEPKQYLAEGGIRLDELKQRFEVPNEIWVAILRHNDNDRWTREKIADWLEAKGL